MTNTLARIVIALGLVSVPALVAAADLPPPVPTEESGVATISAVTPHWVFVSSSWEHPGARIIDGDSGKMMGQVHMSMLADFALDPLGRYFYVAESIWTKGNRGTRQDMVTVYDAHTLKLVREIPVPGRLLVGNRRYDLSISSDGLLAYIYNFDPASSVVVVDLAKGKTLRSIETPGCGIAAALPEAKFLSLCANGDVAVTPASGKSAMVHSTSFFSGEDDPVFDSSPIDPGTGVATLLTYTGTVYTMTPGKSLVPGSGWSIPEAAGLPRATSASVLVNWFPTGPQPAAVNAATGKLFVLMHMGEYWTHKDPGTEIWVLDLATHALLSRHKLEDEATSIQVSQDAKPLLFVNAKGKLLILDALTFEQKHKLDDVAGGPMTTIASR